MKNELKLPTGWKLNKFKTIFTTEKGLSITKENLQDEGLAVVNYGQIHSIKGMEINCKFDNLPFISLKYLKRAKSALLNYGDFVFADTSEDIDGSGNFKMNVSEDGLIFAGYHSIIARLKNSNHPRYFMYLFESDWFRCQIQDSVSGVKVYSVTQLILKNTKVIRPSFPEQIAIAEFLDNKVSAMDKSINLLELEVKVLGEFKKSLIYETVTKGLNSSVKMKDSGVKWIGKIPENWEVKRLKYVMDNHDSKRQPIEASERSQVGETLYDYYGASGVVDKIDDYIFDMDALLIGEDGANLVMRSLPLIYIAKGKYWVNNHAHILTPKENHDLTYMAFLMETLDYSDFITGSAQPKLSQEKLNNILLLTPPYIEQLEISKYLVYKTENIDKILDEKKVELKLLKQIRKSIIFEYVTGKKRVDL